MNAVIPSPSVTSAPSWLHRALRHRSFVIGAVLSLLLLLAAALSLVWTPWSPYEMDLASKLQSPTGTHWLGTDTIGRDIFSRLIYGAQITIFVALASSILSFSLGSFLGFLAAVRGGWVDQVLSRIVDLVMAVPSLIVALVMLSVLPLNNAPKPGMSPR